MNVRKSGLLSIISISLLFFACRTNRAISFVIASDTHCLDSLNRYEVLDSMITDLNHLHEVDFPDSLSFLKKQKQLGLLISGDLTDNARQGQWNEFEQLFGLNGEGHLKMPVYDNYGNHDGDTTGIVRTAIKKRNPLRRNLTNISANGMHYSWDWDNYHFVSLGSYPGNTWDSTCNWCHYFKTSFRDPQNSLVFLKDDLAKYGNGKKVIMYFHYGWDTFSLLWWTEAEQQHFYETIKAYNIAAIFTGHNHAPGYINWKGYDVYSVGSPQNGNKTGNYMAVQIRKDSLYVLERRYGKWGRLSYRKALQ